MIGPVDGVVSIVHIFNQLDRWDFTLGIWLGPYIFVLYFHLIFSQYILTLGIWLGPYIELSLGGSFGGLSLLADLHCATLFFRSFDYDDENTIDGDDDGDE